MFCGYTQEDIPEAKLFRECLILRQIDEEDFLFIFVPFVIFLSFKYRRKIFNELDGDDDDDDDIVLTWKNKQFSWLKEQKVCYPQAAG